MKVRSKPEGDGLVSNAEVLAWLKEKNFEMSRKDVPDGVIKTPSSTANVARDVREYIESSPAGSQTVESVKQLFSKLEKYKLSSPELLMIANIRPEAYAHLTALIADVHSRFDDDQLYEMLDVINSTLEKKPLTTEGGIQRNNDGTEGMEKAAKSNGKSTNMPIDATTPIEEQPQTQVNDAANAVKSVRIAGTTHMKEAGIQSSIEQTPHVQQNAAPTVNASAASQAQICDASITDYTAVPAAVNVSQPSKNGHKNIGANSTRLTRGASNENQNRDKAEKVVKGGGAEATITDYYAINKKGGSGGADGKKKEPHGKS